MKNSIFKTFFVAVASLLEVCTTALSQSQVQLYECKADSIEVFGAKLPCVSMAGYDGIAEGMYGNYTCKLSLAWLGLPALGGIPIYLLQFDIRPGKEIEPIAKKRSYRGLVAFEDNGMGTYDIGNAQSFVYSEGVRVQYMIPGDAGCMELLKKKNIAQLTVTDSVYNIVRSFEFKNFCSASALACMDKILQETFRIVSDSSPLIKDMKAPLVYNVTENAEFPGGEDACQQFLNKNTVYPKGAITERGYVRVSFIVNEDGKLSNFEAFESDSPLIDAEALRVAKLMPMWTPAKFYGKPVKTEKSVVLNFITESAHFPNGDQAFDKFCAENLVYPQGLRDMGIEGIVKVNFIVDEKGNLSDFRLANHVDPTLDAEALRVARLMPAWVPAKFHGQPVKSIGTAYFFFQRLTVPKKLP